MAGDDTPPLQQIKNGPCGAVFYLSFRLGEWFYLLASLSILVAGTRRFAELFHGQGSVRS